MAIKIGQASIDENGNIVGGKAGDQSGRETNYSSWYAGGWTLLLRPMDKKVAEKMAVACEDAVENSVIGYDQQSRNTLRAEAKRKGWNLMAITTPCETDCSALMAVCAEAAGVKMDAAYQAGNAPATFQMRQQWPKTGAFFVLTESKYLTSDAYLRRGDVLVNESAHTVMALEDGPKGYEYNREIIINGKTYGIDGLLQGGQNFFAVREFSRVLNEAGVENEISNKGNVAVLTFR